MRRYWVEKKDIYQDQVNFTGDVFHHIFDVCRQEEGSKFEVLTEDSKAYFVQVTQVGRKTAAAQVLEERTIPALKNPHINIALSISRFPVMDAIMEKAVEMGVARIQPFFSDFSFVRSDEKISPNKLERWTKIIRSATQQSGRGDLMQVLPALPFADVVQKINQNPHGAGLFAYEGESTLSIKEAAHKMRQASSEELQEVWIIVGSEGGFSDREVQELQKLGLDPVTLGPQVLRVETACMTLVSVLKYEFDLMC